MKIIYTCLLLALSFTAKSQLIKWYADKPLTWADFKGPVNESIPHQAYTHCRFNYTSHWSKRDGKYTFNFKMGSGFDPEASWCRPGKQTEPLLKHEQLHFDIHELYARKMY